MEDNEPTGAVRRLNLALQAATFEALMSAAWREDRPGKVQALRYIETGLRRDGYLSPVEPSSGDDRDPEPWYAAPKAGR